jgi:hypothetical protein
MIQKPSCKAIDCNRPVKTAKRSRDTMSVYPFCSKCCVTEKTRTGKPVCGQMCRLDFTPIKPRNNVYQTPGTITNGLKVLESIMSSAENTPINSSERTFDGSDFISASELLTLRDRSHHIPQKISNEYSRSFIKDQTSRVLFPKSNVIGTQTNEGI